MASRSTGPSPAPRAPTPSQPSKVFERLATPSRPGPDLPPVRPPSRCLTPSEESASIKRLYCESSTRKNASLARLEERVYGTSSTSVGPRLSHEETEDLVNRMYARRLETFAAKKEKLTHKYLAKSEVHMKRFASPSEKEAALDRLYNTKDRDAKRSDELFAKYNPDKKATRRSADEITTNVDRWYGGGFAKRQ